MEKLTWLPIENVPFFGVFTTFRCGGGGVQFRDPESWAEGALSAVAIAAGFGCNWHADPGVL
jgi:hypothetical protein